MRKLIITEEEKRRIVEMHNSPKKRFVFEQPETPVPTPTPVPKTALGSGPTPGPVSGATPAVSGETKQADALVEKVDTAKYCTPSAPSWVMKKLNSLTGNDNKMAKDFIKFFGNYIKGKSLKEILSIRKDIKNKKAQAEQEVKNVNENPAVVFTILGYGVTASVLVAIGAILLFIIVIVVIVKSSKGGGGCGDPNGWWNTELN